MLICILNVQFCYFKILISEMFRKVLGFSSEEIAWTLLLFVDGRWITCVVKLSLYQICCCLYTNLKSFNSSWTICFNVLRLICHLHIQLTLLNCLLFLTMSDPYYYKYMLFFFFNNSWIFSCMKFLLFHIKRTKTLLCNKFK